MGAQAGFLQPTGAESGAGGPFTVAGIFGHAAPSPLVMTSGGEGNYLEIGAAHYESASMSGVQTVDVGGGALSAVDDAPHAKNLLKPMHSEAFWILVLALAAVGLFSAAGNLRLGPVKLSGGVG